MVFSTPVFLFYFLVLTLLVYYLVPRKLRNVVILISSLIFYYWGEQTYVVIMFLSTAIDFTHGMLVEHFKGKGQITYAKMAVASSMFFNLLLLLFFKYWANLVIKFSALAFLLLEFSTKSKIFATVDSPKGLFTFTWSTPVRLTQPLTTSSPACTSRGRDSPVRAAVSREEVPSNTVPSRGTRSPALTTITSPTETSSGSTWTSSPFRSMLA